MTPCPNTLPAAGKSYHSGESALGLYNWTQSGISKWNLNEGGTG
jgi:hypothetical protein